MRHEISLTLGDYASDYDVDSIHDTLVERGYRTVDEVPEDEYNQLLEANDGMV